MPWRAPGAGDPIGTSSSANEPGWVARQAALAKNVTTWQTEVAGHLRGLVARQGDGVDRERSAWEMTGAGTERMR